MRKSEIQACASVLLLAVSFGCSGAAAEPENELGEDGGAATSGGAGQETSDGVGAGQTGDHSSGAGAGGTAVQDGTGSTGGSEAGGASAAGAAAAGTGGVAGSKVDDTEGDAVNEDAGTTTTGGVGQPDLDEEDGKGGDDAGTAGKTALDEPDSGEMSPPAVNGDECRQVAECTNGGDPNDIWDVMTCFAPWEPRPIGTDPGPGCEFQGCPDGYECVDGINCQQMLCASADDCPQDFECGDTGACERLRCTQDADCDAYCVKGRCSAAPGRCGYQTAA